MSELTPENFLNKIKNIETKLSDVDKKKQDTDIISSIDNDLKMDLFRFLSSRINVATARNQVKNLASDLLETRLQKATTGEEEIGTGMLVRILEVIGKQESELDSSILSILKQQITINQFNTNSNNHLIQNNLKEIKNELSDISKEEYQKIKKLVDFIEKAKKTEIPESNERTFNAEIVDEEPK